MGIGPIVLDDVAAVSDPGGIGLTVGAVIAPTARDEDILDYTLPSFVHLPELRGALWADGIKPVRHVVEEKVFRSSILAPHEPLTLIPSGVQATTIFDLDFAGGGATQAPIGGQIVLAGVAVTFMGNLDLTRPSNYGVQVALYFNPAACLTNFFNMIMGGGTEGLSQLDNAANDGIARIRAVIEATSNTGTQVGLRVLEFGSDGNGVPAYLSGNVGLGFAWDGVDHSLGSTTTGVGTVGYFLGGSESEADPPAPGPGSFRYLRTHYRTEDQGESGRSPYAETEFSPAQDVTVGNFVLEDDPSVTHNRWYRTAAQGGIFRLGRTLLEFVVSDLDTLSDTQLSGPGEVRYDELAFRRYEDGHAPRVRWIARHRGRIFGGGADLSADYEVGTASVVEDTYTVSIVGGVVTHDLEGRWWRVSDLTEWYLIVECDPVANSFELNRTYVGSDVVAQGYVVSDVQARNNNELFWSEPLRPSRWPTKNSILAITTPSPEGITGMVEHQDALVVFTATGIWEVTPSALTEFQARNRYEGVGCVGGHSIVSVEGQLLFAATDGIYAWSGGRVAPVKISNPTVGADGTASGIQGTWNRVNGAHAHEIEAHFDPHRRLVRWFVPLDSDTVARHAIVLDLQTGNWCLDAVSDFRAVETVVSDGGDLITLAGGVGGQIFELDKGTIDGFFDEAPIRTLTARSALTLTVAGETWTVDALAGLPVWVVSADGDFYRETIASNGADELVLSGEVPSVVGNQIVIGGICQDMESGRWELDDPGRRKTFARLRALYSRRTRGQYFVATGRDSDELRVREITSGSLGEADGETLHRAQRVGRRHGYRVICIEPGVDPEFTGLELEIIGRDRPDA